MEPALAWFRSLADSERCTMTWGREKGVSPRPPQEHLGWGFSVLCSGWQERGCCPASPRAAGGNGSLIPDSIPTRSKIMLFQGLRLSPHVSVEEGRHDPAWPDTLALVRAGGHPGGTGPGTPHPHLLRPVRVAAHSCMCQEHTLTPMLHPWPRSGALNPGVWGSLWSGSGGMLGAAPAPLRM